MATLELRNVNKTYGAGLPDTLKNNLRLSKAGH